jgi:hypothetical protein
VVKSDVLRFATHPGNTTLAVPLTPDQWSSVFGRFGKQNATTLNGFQDVLGNLGHVGMTFGGGCFFGHGVKHLRRNRALCPHKLYDLVVRKRSQPLLPTKTRILGLKCPPSDATRQP